MSASTQNPSTTPSTPNTQNLTPIRTLIVDDEAPARQWLRRLCNKVADVQVVGECATAAEASRALRSSTIDLLLLDIQLGPHNGFQVLDGVPCSAVPQLVFVTAHDQYAVRAFDRRAIDYLLKPVPEDRFRDSLERVRRQLRGGLTSEVQAAVRETIGPLERSLMAQRAPAHIDRLTAERDDAYRVIECRRIATLESQGNYVHVLESGDSRPSVMRGTLQSVCAVLDPEVFVRINRSVIVNLTCVDRIERDADSHLVFVMRDNGRRFNVGRAFHGQVVQVLRL
jgi:two-component system, LytTR family, response regulator